MDHVLGAGKAAAGKKSLFREALANASVFLVSVALAWGAAEAYLSFAVDDGLQFDLEMWRYAREIKRPSANPAIGHEHTPHSHARLMGVDVAISSQGLRDREFPAAPPPGRTRILMLGDSLTFGWGVPAEHTYAKRVEALLRAAGHDVEVINTGVGNYNTEMQVAWFLERGAKLNPHMVVLNYFINDAEPTPHYGTHFLAEHSRAFVYFTSRLDAVLRMAGIGSRKDWRAYYASLYEGDEGIGRVAAAIERLAAYCREHRIELVLANYPELRQPADYPFPQVDALVQRIAEANRVAYLPMLPAVRGLAPETLWVTPPDPHPSSVAHEAFAKALFRALEPRL